MVRRTSVHGSGLSEEYESAARNSRQRAEDDEELFNAMQNARVVKNAELYYRTMFLSEESTWNLRAHHMAEMLDMLAPSSLAVLSGLSDELLHHRHDVDQSSPVVHPHPNGG